MSNDMFSNYYDEIDKEESQKRKEYVAYCQKAKRTLSDSDKINIMFREYLDKNRHYGAPLTNEEWTLG